MQFRCTSAYRASLLKPLKKLSPDLQAEILHYAEYLATKYVKNLSYGTPSKQYCQAGTINENLPKIQ